MKQNIELATENIVDVLNICTRPRHPGFVAMLAS